MSVDSYSYAWPTDPLVRGFIEQSGLADSSPPTSDATGSNFTYVASQVGCPTVNTTKDQIFACMQNVSASTVINVYNTYNATLNGGRSLSFGPRPDNQTFFSNYTDRQQRGLFAKLPTIVSQVNNEGSSLLGYTPQGPVGGQAAVDALTRSLSTCPGARGAAARRQWGVPAWRTRYFGEWPNLNPLPWLGAYHSSDIPMVFGTSDLRGPDTPAEAATSKYYQAAWIAFVRDPVNGLTKYGWPLYNPNATTLVKLGNGSTSAIFGAGNEFDAGC